ncbi:MAG: hypothetical protein EA385_15105 [Salinarimonadaceae bacterium]|nr:MAG: hypothetical protein EA385_15105 [Salinarimonadaceae bacterium]
MRAAMIALAFSAACASSGALAGDRVGGFAFECRTDSECAAEAHAAGLPALYMEAPREALARECADGDRTACLYLSRF